MSIEFADLLGQYLHRADCSAGRLSRLSDIPLRTLENWLNGRVRKPRRWQGIAQAAASLHLSAADTDRLLQSAGHPTLNTLRDTAVSPQDQSLLQLWPPTQQNNPPPFQAIADLSYFVGREAEIAAMQQAILQHKRVVIHNLQGMGGIGKTSLAAHLAYQLRPHFPDGVLWAQVDAGSSMAILTSFAAAYGQDVSQHTDLENRARAVRAILAHKTALIILDNVENDGQIRPLLPPNGRCAIILTSRKRNLAATLGMQHIHLQPFNDQEALALFAKILGDSRVHREQADLLALSRLLGHLPLAISIVAGRLAYDAEQTAVSFLTHLQENWRQPGRLKYGDLNVKATFNVSYAMLPPDEQQFFAALGVFSGKDFSIPAAAAAANIPAPQARCLLETLHKLSLVQQSRPERFTLHPLLRIFAREHITDDAVYGRFAAFFTAYIVEHEHTYNNLDLELDNIFAALRTASKLPDKSDLVTGINALCEFLFIRGMYQEAEDYLTLARQACSQLDDNTKSGQTLRNLGIIAHRRGQYKQARQLFQKALHIARHTEDLTLHARILVGLGGTAYNLDQYDLTEKYWLESLDIMQKSGDERQIVAILVNLGSVSNLAGNQQRARQYWMKSLALARKTGHQTAESAALTNLASIDMDQGYLARAEGYIQQALQIAVAIQRKRGICKLYNYLSDIAISKKEYSQAKQHAKKALQIARKIDEPIILRASLANHGRAAAYRGEYEEAEFFLQESLHISEKLAYQTGICMALCYIGKLEKLRCNALEAQKMLQESLALAQQTKNLFMIADNSQELGEVYLLQDDLDRASANFQGALSAAQAYDFYPHEGMALFGLAQIALKRKDAAQAKTHGEAAQAVFAKIDYKIDSRNVQRWLDSLPLTIDAPH